MKPWTIVDRTTAPDGSELRLIEHDGDMLIMAGRQNLMTSRAHGSEEALAAIGCRHAAKQPRPQVLIGGLGMGFTLRAALDRLPPSARVTVVELLPAVIEWNRGPLGRFANHPLNDARVEVVTGDVSDVLEARRRTFDAVLLDVDNGPEPLTTAGNARLYDHRGITRMLGALAPFGTLALWSAVDEPGFEQRLSRVAGIAARRERVRSRGKRGARHTILVLDLGGDRSR